MSLSLLALPVHAGAGYKALTLDGSKVGWPARNGATVITYSIAISGPAAGGSENCRKTTGVHDLMARSHLHTEAFRDALAHAFRLWSLAANVQFVQAEPGSRADLIIAAQGEPDGIAFTDVTHTSEKITRAVVCLNPEVSWTADNAEIEGAYRLYYVLAHEIGHAIGLDHPSPDGELMSYEYSRTRVGLQPGDIAGAVSLYGASRRQTADASDR